MDNHASRALILCLLVACSAPSAIAQANVLLIIGDDVGVPDLGCYGFPGAPPTPNLNALAAGGLRCRRAYANPACAPTRAALLTGRHGFRTGVPTTLEPTDPGINTNEILLPALLPAPTFASALIGKWNLGGRYGDRTPNVQGFQHFAGILGPGLPDYYQWTKLVNGVPVAVNHYATSEQVDDAIAWISGRTTPWFLSLAFTAPHQPFHAPPPALHTRNLAGLTPQTSPRAFYQATVEALDTEVGRLLAAMSPAVRANTNVIFMSDNGADGAVVPPPLSLNHTKGSLYEGGSRVPLIVNGPAVAGANRVTDALVSVVDLFPTILHMLGAPATGITLPLDGQSMMPLLAGTGGTVRNHVYVDMSASPYGGGYSIRNARYDLVRILAQQPQQQEFYDLVADPFEQNNLLLAPLSPAHQAAFDQLTSLLAGYRGDGWVEGFGAGCAGRVGVPRLRAQTMPRIGQGYVFQIQDLAPGVTSLLGVAGFDRTFSHGVPLPFNLGPIGMPGCELLVSRNATVSVFLNTGYGYMTLPNYSGYVGLEFYLQGFVIEPGANPASLITTRALRCVIGR